MAKSFNARMKDRFTKITNDYRKVNEYVHETAMMIAKHAKEHGDCSTAQGLVMALPASSRREMLILWFSTYTPIVVKNSENFESKMHKPESKMYREWDLEAADADPFYEMANRHKETPPKDLEALIGMIHSLGNRINKMVEEGKVEEADVPAAEALAEQVAAFKFKRPKAAANTNNEPVSEAA